MKRLYYNLRRLENAGIIKKKSQGRGHPTCWGHTGKEGHVPTKRSGGEKDGRSLPRLCTRKGKNERTRLLAIVDWINENSNDVWMLAEKEKPK